jgi:hypothetical protein
MGRTSCSRTGLQEKCLTSKGPFLPSSTLMAGVTAMTSGLMLTIQTSTLQDGAPRQDIPWSHLSVGTPRTLCPFSFHKPLTTLPSYSLSRGL